VCRRPPYSLKCGCHTNASRCTVQGIAKKTWQDKGTLQAYAAACIVASIMTGMSTACLPSQPHPSISTRTQACCRLQTYIVRSASRVMNGYRHRGCDAPLIPDFMCSTAPPHLNLHWCSSWHIHRLLHADEAHGVMQPPEVCRGSAVRKVLSHSRDCCCPDDLFMNQHQSQSRQPIP
jgi:hypothetical protein